MLPLSFPVGQPVNKSFMAEVKEEQARHKIQADRRQWKWDGHNNRSLLHVPWRALWRRSLMISNQYTVYHCNQARTQRDGGVTGVETTSLAPVYLFIFCSLACQRGRLCTRIPLPRIWKNWHNYLKEKVSDPPPPPPAERISQGWRGITACFQFQNIPLKSPAYDPHLNEAGRWKASLLKEFITCCSHCTHRSNRNHTPKPTSKLTHH